MDYFLASSQQLAEILIMSVIIEETAEIIKTDHLKCCRTTLFHSDGRACQCCRTEDENGWERRPGQRGGGSGEGEKGVC